MYLLNIAHSSTTRAIYHYHYHYLPPATTATTPTTTAIMDFLKQAQGALGGQGQAQGQAAPQQGQAAGQPGAAAGQQDALGEFGERARMLGVAWEGDQI